MLHWSSQFPSTSRRILLVKNVSVYQVLLVAAAMLSAGSVTAQPPVPVRELSAPSAKSTETFGAILGVREIADGKLLVNDARRHQLSVLDAKLANKTVVLDSVAGTRQGYGRYAAPMIPYLGDSTLLVDREALSLLVLDPRGVVARVSSAPKPGDLYLLSSRASGTDPKGNLLYLGEGDRTKDKTGGMGLPDSAPVVRANFETRNVDTLGQMLRRIDMRTTQEKVGDEYVLTHVINPLPTFDEWTSLSDGSVAIVRGDYHIDFVRPDGSHFSGPKIPFDWKRLTDADKQALIDSLRTVREKREKTSECNADVSEFRVVAGSSKRRSASQKIKSGKTDRARSRAARNSRLLSARSSRRRQVRCGWQHLDFAIYIRAIEKRRTRLRRRQQPRCVDRTRAHAAATFNRGLWKRWCRVSDVSRCRSESWLDN